MQENTSLNNISTSSLHESAIIYHGLNLFLGSGLAILGTLGILSLLFLITTIVVFKNTTEASYIIILSLALCDIGHLSVVVGHVAPELLLRELSLAWGLETFFTHSNLLFWYSSLGHLCLMAINRYYAVCRPVLFSTVFSARRARRYCACVWFIGFALAMTPFTGLLCCRKIFDIHYDAEEEEVRNEQTNILKIITIILNWLTVVVMAFCYIAVFMRLRAKAGAVNAKPQTARQLELLASKNKKRRNISYQFSIISVVFWLLLCFQIVGEFGYKQKWVITTLQILYTLNSAVNPAIYLGFNSALRMQMLTLARCKQSGVEPRGTHDRQLEGGNFQEAQPPRNQEELHKKRLARIRGKPDINSPTPMKCYTAESDTQPPPNSPAVALSL